MKSTRIANGIGLAKAASATAAQLTTLGGAAHGLGSLIRGAIGAGADIGGGLATGMGLSPTLGRVVGGAVPVVAGLEAGRRGKRRFDAWRYANGLYSDPGYYY